jgi:uncharacterized protein
MPEKRARGFAAMDPEQQRQIASMGGRAAHQRGTAHEWDSREAAEAGRKGGKAAHHRGARMVQSANGAAQENGHPHARGEEANGSIPRTADTGLTLPDARRENPGQGGTTQSDGIRRDEPQWSENEYENRGTPGAGMAVHGNAGVNTGAR